MARKNQTAAENSWRFVVYMAELLLSNLLGNAWKFTSKMEKGRIEFGTVEQDGRTVYYVKDNGAGFDPQYIITIRLNPINITRCFASRPARQ